MAENYDLLARRAQALCDNSKVRLLAYPAFCFLTLVLLPDAAPGPAKAGSPTYYRQVVPILQQHCQVCHRPREIAPMPLVTYEQSSAWAGQIRDTVRSRKMPPWFADPCCGHFSDDPSLTEQEIATLSAWADAKAPEGDTRHAPPPRQWTEGDRKSVV